MIEIHINKDLGSFEAKLIGPFTARQTICLAVAAPICFFIYKYTTPFLSADAAGYLIAIPAAIAVAFGWWKPYGMKTEKFIQSVFINMVLAPMNRKYKTDNVHEKAFTILEKHAKEQEAAALKAESKKTKTPKPKQQKKPRYVVSPEAVK